MSDQVASPFRLKAMTLRGIGSYLLGQRLEIRPLTILCGTNGSGKSTWFKVLRYLRDRTDLPYFPFALPMKRSHDTETTTGKADESYELYNAILNVNSGHGADAEHRAIVLAALESAEHDLNYGPLATIGLTFEITSAKGLHPCDAVDPSVTGSCLALQNRFSSGAELTIRITLPEDGLGTDGWIKQLELSIDNTPVLRYTNSRTDSGETNAYTVRSRLSAYLKGDHSIVYEEDWLETGTAEFSENSNINTDEDQHRLICVFCLNYFVSALRDVLNSIFPIGAIRDILSYTDIKELEGEDIQDLERIIHGRYVGFNGKWSTIILDGNTRSMPGYASHLMFQMEPCKKYRLNTYNPIQDKYYDCDLGNEKIAVGMSREVPVVLYPFEVYVANWMRHLVDVVLKLGKWGWDYSVLPNGYLANKGPYADTYEHDADDSRWMHPCCHGSIAYFSSFSAGFHQVLPIVIQLGLMRKYELTLIENPEVHLHPSLQVRLMDLIIKEAKLGKQIIVETHSDIVVYSVLRAILEEEIKQAAVAMYFSDLKWVDWEFSKLYERFPGLKEDMSLPVGERDSALDDLKKQFSKYLNWDAEVDWNVYGSHSGRRVLSYDFPLIGVSYSDMRLISVDEDGMIEQWPKGFLDEQMHQSRRMVKLMYGKLYGAEADDND